VLEHQQHLEQGAGEGGGLHVPDVALDAGHPERDRPVPAAEDLADRVPLDLVVGPGPVACASM
jgi:hypothetical protein